MGILRNSPERGKQFDQISLQRASEAQSGKSPAAEQRNQILAEQDWKLWAEEENMGMLS